MTTSFVLDASVALAWCFEDETSTYAEHVLDYCAAAAEVYVTEIWALEIANALISAQRRGRIAEDRISEFLVQLFRFRITVETSLPGRTLVAVRSLARSYGLTAYDASYLELAIRRRLPLATLDVDLKRAAGSAKVSLLDVP